MSLSDMFRRRDDGRAAEPLDSVRVAIPPKAPPIIGGIIVAALAAVYLVEGGYVNDPHDRGGETRYGITEATAKRHGYAGPMREFPKHCGPGAPICADLIYRTDYMERPGFMPMAAAEPAVFYEMVDSAVLHGPARSAGWFVGAVNGVCRTRFKPATKITALHVKAYTDCAANLGRVPVCRRVLDAMDGGQRAFFYRIVERNPSQRRFLKGWLRARVGNVDRAKCGGHV